MQRLQDRALPTPGRAPNPSSTRFWHSLAHQHGDPNKGLPHLDPSTAKSAPPFGHNHWQWMYQPRDTMIGRNWCQWFTLSSNELCGHIVWKSIVKFTLPESKKDHVWTFSMSAELKWQTQYHYAWKKKAKLVNREQRALIIEFKHLAKTAINLPHPSSCAVLETWTRLPCQNSW